MNKLLLIWILLTMPAYPATYYVDASRPNDSGNGTSLGTAKKYISSGIALMSGGGNTLWIQSGTYSNASDAITSVVNGSAGNYNILR